MLETSNEIPVPLDVRSSRKQKIKAEVIETLTKMDPGSSFLVGGAVKRHTVLAAARESKIRIVFGKNAEGELRCWKR